MLPNLIIQPLTDGMFKGIYNGKQCHVSDIAAVLSRAWSAGVDRIIVIGRSLNFFFLLRLFFCKKKKCGKKIVRFFSIWDITAV